MLVLYPHILIYSEQPTNADQIKESEASPKLLSKFNDTKEWNKITQIIDTFGSDIGKSADDCNSK